MCCWNRGFQHCESCSWRVQEPQDFVSVMFVDLVESTLRLNLALNEWTSINCVCLILLNPCTQLCIFDNKINLLIEIEFVLSRLSSTIIQVFEKVLDFLWIPESVCWLFIESNKIFKINLFKIHILFEIGC